MDLLVVLPLILAIATAFTAAQLNRGNFSLRGCPTSCGDIEVPYPFGFTLGCYRPGFKLNCTTSNNTPRLFIGSSLVIEVTSISENSNQLYVSVPYIVSAPDGISRNASWATALVGTPYTISSKYNNLTATGCGVVASLLNPETGATVATCASFCGPEDINISSCNIGFGCCGAIIPSGLRTYSIKLDSRETGSWGGIAAVMANVNYGDDDYYVGAGTLKGSTQVEVVLDWVISPLSCKVAILDLSSYACLNYSRCIDMPEGYICDCESKLDDGNPYVPNSCPEVVTLMSAPADCQRKCGDIDVPFPFGLERGCYRHENFSLKCITENNRQFPTYSGTELIQIMVGDGVMRLKSAEQREILDGLHIYNINNSVYDIGWVVGLGNCKEAKNQSDYPCISTDSYCFVNPLTHDSIGPGYNCGCSKGYHGNPYTYGGCQDIDECSDPDTYECYGTCTNLLGSFTCACDPGIHGNCAAQKTKQVVLRTIFICVSIGFGLLLLLFCGVILHKKMKQRTREKIKQKYFQKNSDLLLQQKISNGIVNARIKIFSLEDLEKATNNFDDTRIVGSGGHGIVYKGILSDQRVVAIKKSKKVVETEIEQFINEIFILSIIKHGNVVKLFGCCLEMEVPLLVYEFITNGSLSDHLHPEEHTSSLSWDDRLRIASETAGALTYLHSDEPIPIFHRDVKTSNILLDDNFSAKVSDFGASRPLRVDKRRVLTQIQGTDGYLDPEYQQTFQLTEKSDVYSLGVILVELLTGETPISFTKCTEDVNICTSFLSSLRENRLLKILEPRVIEVAPSEELNAVAKLAEACLNFKGEDRPTMKEVFAILEPLIKAKKTKQLLFRRQSQEEIEFPGKQSVLEL